MNGEGQSPRILLVCDYFVRYSAHLADGLARNGAEAVLLTRDHDREFGDRLGAAREFVKGVVGGRVAHRELHGRFRSPAGLAGVARHRRELRSFDPDFVHVQMSVTSDPRLMFAAGLRWRKFAVTIHDIAPHPGDDVSRRIVIANSWFTRAAGLIFVHGEALRRELESMSAAIAPVVSVPHGVDPVVRTPLPGRPSILLFGRLSHYKGIDVLLEAMDRVWSELPTATLTIAGSGDLPQHPALADPRVRLLVGHISDAEIPDLVSNATCIALPYREASQSGVGALAKQYGRPLVVTSVGGLPELVADGSGLIVPPEDPVRLSAALVSVLSNRELAGQLGDAGAHSAADRSSWRSVARTTLQAYEQYLPPGAP